MISAGGEADLARAERVAFVASHLLSRSVLLGQLLVRQVGPHQISRTEASVLDILGDGPRRITELAELAGLAQPTMTLLIRRLEEDGWVTRERLPQDGRVVMVTVAEAGTAVLESFRASVLAALRADLERLPDDELAALCAATETLGSFVDELRRGVGR